MAYLNYGDMVSIYGDAVSATDFNRFEYDAEVLIDGWTTGIDNVHKLRIAFPTEPMDAEAVRRCCAALVNALAQFEQVQAASIGASAGGAIASMSSGSESISYRQTASALSVAAGSVEGRNAYLGNIVRQYLAGHQDANGVNLLYGGVYPVVPSVEVLNV